VIIIMRHLSNKDKKQLKEFLPLNYEVEKKDNLKIDGSIMYRDDEPFLVILGQNEYAPHMDTFNDTDFPFITVDDGAMPYVAKGADMMRPGIVQISDNVVKDQLVAIKSETYNKSIAIGRALFDSNEIKTCEKGRMVKMIHYMGDSYCG